MINVERLFRYASLLWRKGHFILKLKKNVMFKRECKFILAGLLSMTTYNKIIAQSASEWKMQPVALQTRWAKDVNPQYPLPEYPRPQMMRKHNWQNLNGLWQYSITTKGAVQPSRYDGQILVPYAIESALSGVKKKLLPTENLWYFKTFEKPVLKTGEKLLLHFGAVDWQATVYINGKEVGSHTGGYTAFSFDITNYLRTGKNELVVKVFDPSDQGINPHGKQTLEPANIYYTASSGIWQTVWLESVASSYLTELNITPDIDKGVLHLKVNLTGDSRGYSVEAIAYTPSGSVAKVTGTFNVPHQNTGIIELVSNELSIPIKSAHLWSPDNPFLYDLVIRLKKDGKIMDEVVSYFGMRKIDIQKDVKGINRIFLNNKPYFNLGVLDQGYSPEGLYTPATDEALAFDIKAIKKMGFNTIRKHIKVESARWYHYADKIGILVWQDMVNPPQSLPEGAKVQYEKEVQETLNQLHNYPSITTWVIFNERWGAYDQQRITDWVKQQDPSRIVNGHSGEYLYVNNQLRQPSEMPYLGSDLTDVHSYPEPRDAMQMSGKAKVLGEFGGLGLSVTGHQWDDLKGWGYVQVSPTEMESKYVAMLKQLQQLQQLGLSGSIYTQPFDVEGEENGIMTYDRKIIKIPVIRLQELHKAILNTYSEEVRSHSTFVIGQNMDRNETDEQYPTLLVDFDKGKHDSTFLRRLALIAFRKKDQDRVNQIGLVYLNGLTTVFAKENLDFFRKITLSTKDIGFQLFFSHPEEINAILGKDVAGDFVRSLIRDEVQPILFDKAVKPDVVALESATINKYGDEGQQVFWIIKALYYYFANDIKNWYATKILIHQKYPNVTSVFDMNNDAWLLFTNVTDSEQLRTALSWSKSVIEKEPTANYYDTYANILYKLGRTDQAIKMQEKGLKLPVGNASIESIRSNLEKMKCGKKTWQ
jgi:hypothetical protein